MGLRAGASRPWAVSRQHESGERRLVCSLDHDARQFEGATNSTGHGGDKVWRQRQGSRVRVTEGAAQFEWCELFPLDTTSEARRGSLPFTFVRTERNRRVMRWFRRNRCERERETCIRKYRALAVTGCLTAQSPATRGRSGAHPRRSRRWARAQLRRDSGSGQQLIK